ncbi:MAG: chitobiase/beta-hexosaminidase C-terminal domain-containing protein [Candidatus Dormiibacterota bacterium]
MRRPGVCLALAIAMVAVAPAMFGPGVLSARAATSTIVSLNFDNNTASEFTLGYQQGLQPHAVPATFYVNSGTVATGTSTTKISWTQLGTLASAGDEIGGKTTDGTNLTTLTSTQQINEICGDRLNIMSHGIVPFTFAYPAGAFNTTIESEVQNCGYGNARTSGSLSPTGPTYAETTPPKNWLAMRAWSATVQVTLTNLENLVNGAATTGGLVPIVIQKVCSPTDPNESTCLASAGAIDLADLNTFLTWVQNAGQTGGAPAGTVFKTMGAAATSADTVAPTTLISCNGAPCQSSTYSGTVSVALAATDLGSGVATTRYTTDGSTPTLTSPAYTGPFSLTASTTVEYSSWDNAGNAEAVNTQALSIQPPPDTTPPTTTITCNNAPCLSTPYIGTVSVTLNAADNAGGWGVAHTYYTTDGSTPTTSSPVYSGPFALTTSTNVQFFSTDLAGNTEQVESQQVQVQPYKTAVSLTFDNGGYSQYTLGWQQALQPHGVTASFYVNSGTIGRATTLSWAQLSALAAAGNDIGGKTVDDTNLTTLSAAQQIAEICNDRQTILQHGITPTSFAYPGGFFNAGLEQEVESCGYGNARTAGSLSPTGPTYAETLPPKDWLGLRAYAPTGQITPATLEALVTGAAAHGGGWVPIVIQRVCSSTLDPGNYATCTSVAGWIDLGDLNTFLTWVQNSGQSGGAPAGSVFEPIHPTATSADTVQPVSSVSCNGAPCLSTTYQGTVYVTLQPTDVGSGVASTRYTTDGSTPSPTNGTLYTGTFPLTASTTVTYESWDYAGNATGVGSVSIALVEQPDSTPPVTSISCNGAPCATTPYTAPVTVTLTATDNPNGGWGVANTYYTTDGSTPTTSSTVYTGPFTAQQDATIRYFSTDLAGNAELPQSQTINFATIVTITFDDGYEAGYSLAFEHVLLPDGNVHATFYVNTGQVGVDPNEMTYAEMTTLYNHSDEIAGHGLQEMDLTSSAWTQQQKIDNTCIDRANLIAHGFDPVGFAYGYGAYNANAESIVQGCGYTTARAAGGIDVAGVGAGPVYSETIPPKNMLATRTIYNGNGTNEIPLSYFENSVTSAYQNGGGWVPVVIHDICSQTYDPAGYSACVATGGAVELDTISAFVTWLQNAGQPGGAPVGTATETIRQLLFPPDTTPPVTTISCDGAPCQASTYNGSTTLALSPTDAGGAGVKATYYTTDGTTPTTSSPQYTGPWTIAQNTTVEFFSVDNAGNTEAVETQQIQVTPNPDPIIGAAGDIACDPLAPAFNNGFGVSPDCVAASTEPLLTGVDAVLPLGDTQYNCGGYQAFLQSYALSWGQKLAITHPVPGDNDYGLELPAGGGTDCPATNGAGYFQYFGAAAGDPTKGYYSYNLGTWHVIALNTAQCDTTPAFCAAGSAQDLWLQNDLSHDTSVCTLAYYKDPRFSSTAGGGDDNFQQIWQDLYNGGTDVVLNAGSHWYERFEPLNASGVSDTTYGMQEFVVGTGGNGLDTPATQLPTSQVLNNTTHGIIKMTLHNGSYSWNFINNGESTFTDSGSGNCHTAPPGPDITPPTTTATCNGLVCGTGWYNTAVQVALTATDNVGGSGVAATYYTTDGSTPTTASTVYTAPFTVSSTATVKFFSTDKVGNTEAVKSQAIQVDTVPPTTSISCNSTTCQATYALPVQVGLSAIDNTGGSGIRATYYTTDGSDPTTSGTATAYSAPFTVSQSESVKFYSIDLAGNAEAVKTQAIQITVDTTPPTTSLTCNSATCSTGWYNNPPVTVTLTATDNSGGSGVFATYYTTDGSTPTTSSSVYAGPFTVSATATVKFFSVDNAGNAEAVNSQTIQIDTVAPSTTIACNGTVCSTSAYTSAVTVGLTAADNTGGSGVAATYYTTDGSTPTTSSTLYTAPFNASATTTVKFFSVDNAGNAETVKAQTIEIDTVAPTTTITCNSATCTAWYHTTPVTVALTASDNTGGSGVKATYYTTNGSTPTSSSAVYTAPFTVSATTTVKFFSVDNAGNAEAVKSQAIGIDTVAPTTTITCNSTTCSTGWYKTTPVRVALAATDNSGGSGVKATYYTTNGSTPTTSSTVYTGPFNVSATTTVKFFSVDNAGNAEAVKSQAIQTDTVAPTTTITCNSTTCSTGWYKTLPVTVALVATDNTGGSGVAATYYTTDGSTPTNSSPVYTGPFTVSATATIKFFSVDVAGNKGAVKSQSIRIDAAPPVVSITSPASGSSFALGTKVTVTASASDVGTGSGAASGIATVTFYLNGTTVLATVKTSPYTFAWNTTKLVRGTYSLTAVATDNAGNSTTSTAVTVHIT